MNKYLLSLGLPVSDESVCCCAVPAPPAVCRWCFAAVPEAPGAVAWLSPVGAAGLSSYCSSPLPEVKHRECLFIFSCFAPKNMPF